MTQFTRPLDIRKVEGTNYWELLAPIVFHVDTYPSDEVITVPAEFKTDFGSIPPQAWSIIGHPLGKGAQAFGVHDWDWRHPASGLPEGAKPRTRRRVYAFSCPAGRGGGSVRPSIASSARSAAGSGRSTVRRTRRAASQSCARNDTITRRGDARDSCDSL